MNAAKLTIYFEDGTTEEIVMTEVLELNIPGRSLEFRQAKLGKWHMVVTRDLLNGRKLDTGRMMQLERTSV